MEQCTAVDSKDYSNLYVTVPANQLSEWILTQRLRRSDSMAMNCC
jgi:hypothetical protein